jgi:two-component system cell cycle sensor histidine kinase/response regulator CckA
LIEDNPGDARLIQEMLKDENFVGTLEHSDSLSKGLACLANKDVDAILLDLSLPDSQGLATFEKIYSVTSQVPIVILTGLKDDATGLEAVRRGAQDYLVKGKLDGALLIKALTYAVERKKLDEAVKRQADLIDLSPDAIIIKKPDDTITFWSLGAENLYGYTKKEAIGQKTKTLLKTKSIQAFESIDTQLKKNGKWSGELTHHTNLGRELAIQSYWLAKTGKNNQVLEVFESNVDITERKNAERLATIGATAGMVGHDIRNPLQTIAGELFLAKDALKTLADNECKQSMEESLDIIEEQMGYVNKIVSDLQDYAKPLQPKLEEVDIEIIVESVLASIHRTQTDHSDNIQVEYKISSDSRLLMTDKTYLQRILQNLVTNSVQAMPNGGKLTITTRRVEDKIDISVEDTGEGIPIEVRGRLFTPLVTMKSKGQGFGLAVVKKFTEGLGGTITFDSEVGKGTRFDVQLPS